MSNIEVRTKEVEVPVSFRRETVEYYVTTDGKQFDSDVAARKHQDEIDEVENRRRKWAEIKQFTVFSDFIDDMTWYYAGNDEQLETIKSMLGWNEKYAYHHKHGEIETGRWITNIFEDGGDYRSTYNWWELGEFMNDLATFMDKLVAEKSK